MIPVQPQPESGDFDEKVRSRGLADLEEEGIVFEQPLPDEHNLSPHWTDCLDDLHIAYQGVCAYSAVYIDELTGARTVDHFRPKRKYPGLAYEWDNFRLACLRMNRRKGESEDVIDPFQVGEDWFWINFSNGTVCPNSSLSREQKKQVEQTIARLKLNDTLCCSQRLKYFELAVQKEEMSIDLLKKRAPFVWKEARRQNLL